MELKKNKLAISNYICSAFMLVLIVLQFTPYWSFGSHKASIINWVWSNPENTNLLSYFCEQIDGVVPSDAEMLLKRGKELFDEVGGVACWQLVFAAVGLGFCALKSSTGIFALFPLANGIYGAYFYMNNEILKLGSYWMVPFVVNILIAVSALVTLILWIVKLVRK